MNILITGGGTREPVDGVRFITNFSTGGTAAVLADHFSQGGHQVTYLHAVDARLPSAPCERVPFDTFDRLNEAMMDALSTQRFDAVLHLAAVSDFSVDRLEIQMAGESKAVAPGRIGKLPSEGDLTLRLKRNFKIVDRIREYSRKGSPVLVAFKLTHSASLDDRRRAVARLIGSSGANFVVQNDFSERKAGQAADFTIYRAAGAGEVTEVVRAASREKLAVSLSELLEGESR